MNYFVAFTTLICTLLGVTNSLSYNNNISIIIQNNQYGLGQFDSCNVPTPVCDPSYRFRSMDGSCNNLKHPTWGMSNTSYNRLGPNNYADGVHAARVSQTGAPLPNARTLSLAYFPFLDLPDKNTLMGTHMGQIGAHDIALSLPPILYNPSLPPCGCNSDQNDPDLCLIVKTPFLDPVYQAEHVYCQPLFRTISALTGDCQPGGPQEQLNANTHFIDMSEVYGSNDQVAQELRSGKGGKLRVATYNGRSYLPSGNPTFCKNGAEFCFEAGDIRVNQNSDLGALQMIFLREHNRICDGLHQINGNWSDELLYQVARQINIAQFQHVYYTEFLPMLLGNEGIAAFNLAGPYSYDENIMPMILNDFNAGAFRYLHSSIQKNYNLVNCKYAVVGEFSFVDEINDPSRVVANETELLLGLTNQHMQQLDVWYSRDINNYLPNPIGAKPAIVDMSTFDIARGRDHAILTYTQAVKVCTGISVDSFYDLNQFMSHEKIVLLKLHYSHVDDVDLFVGINFESTYGSGKLGIIALCIIGEQFSRLRTGDRYFYKNRNQPLPLTPGQMVAAENNTMSSIICRNSDIEEIQRDVFRPHNGLTNNAELCSTLPQTDLSAWLV